MKNTLPITTRTWLTLLVMKTYSPVTPKTWLILLAIIAFALMLFNTQISQGFA